MSHSVLLIVFAFVLVEGTRRIPQYTRTTLYENSDCTGDVIHEYLKLSANCVIPNEYEECYGPGMIMTCVGNVNVVKDLPNWVLHSRGDLDDCGDDALPMKAEGFRTGCHQLHIGEEFLESTKFICQHLNQRISTFVTTDCTLDSKSSRSLGVATVFGKCSKTKDPYVWKTVVCDQTQTK